MKLSSFDDICRRRGAGFIPATVRLSLVAASLATLSIGLAPTLLGAAPKSPAKCPDDVVVVKGVVEVQGVVEELNDALNVPFAQSYSGTFNTGQHTREIQFDVPDGKRLVIETIFFEVTLPLGQRAEGRVFCRSNAGFLVSARVALPSTGFVFPGSTNENLVAFAPFKMRVDGRPGDTAEIALYATRDDTEGRADFTATVCGYLVDI